jgi:hypothetical protein
MKRVFTSAVAAMLMTMAGQAAQAAGWGDLTGTFVYDGAPPSAKPVQVTKDVEFCGKFNLVDESLVVNSDNKGIANIMIYLVPGKGKLEVHPDYEATAKDEIVLDNDKCRFVPQVCLLRTTQTLLIGNKDDVGHNTNIQTLKNQAINPIVPAGGTYKATFTKEESRPANVSCNIHPWMNAKLLVKDHPYMTVSDETGKFTIKNLPAGKLEFQVRHDKYITDVKVGGKKASWKSGKLDVTIADGKPTDLGEILVAPGNF